MPPSSVSAEKLLGSSGNSRHWQTKNHRIRSGTLPKRDRKVTHMYPLLDKVDPQCAQYRKLSAIVDACARTISVWIAAVTRFPSSNDRPSVSGTAQASLYLHLSHRPSARIGHKLHPLHQLLHSSVSLPKNRSLAFRICRPHHFACSPRRFTSRVRPMFGHPKTHQFFLRTRRCPAPCRSPRDLRLLRFRVHDHI
jgi:hypothetical protein